MNVRLTRAYQFFGRAAVRTEVSDTSRRLGQGMPPALLGEDEPGASDACHVAGVLATRAIANSGRRHGFFSDGFTVGKTGCGAQFAFVQKIGAPAAAPVVGFIATAAGTRS